MTLRSIVLFVALAGGMLTTPLIAAEAQQTGKVPRIGILLGSSPAAAQQLIETFRQGLRELGYVEGQNMAIEWRFAEGRFERFPAFASELVRLKVDVIVAATTAAALAVVEVQEGRHFSNCTARWAHRPLAFQCLHAQD